MVRIRTNDIFITDDDKIIFGDHFDSEIFWDSSVVHPTTSGDLRLTTTISGVDPTESYHLTTRWYVDQAVGSGIGVTDHGLLTGLEDDDHLQYVPRTGVRGFTSTVSGVYPVESYHLVTKEYIDQFNPSAEQILFGLQFHYNEYLPEQQTNSLTYIEALRLTISGTDGGGVSDGDYRIGWTFEWRQDRLNYEFALRVQMDDITTIYEFAASPYVDVNYFATLTDFFYMTLSSGIHYVDMDFASTDIKATSLIRNARLEFWRVN